MDALVQAVGGSGISKGEVSRLCAKLDEHVGAFLSRPIEGEWPDLRLDATYVKARHNHRISLQRFRHQAGAHAGLKAETNRVLGATAQRCRIHFLRRTRPSPVPKQNWTARHHARPEALPGDEPA